MTTAPILASLLAASTILATVALFGGAPAETPAPSPTPEAVRKAPPKAKGDDAKAIAKKVQKAYEGVKDYSASFEQTATLKGASATGPKSTGKVFVQKPGKMRWEFEAPEKKTLVSDGKTLWMYEPEENQVIINEHMAETTSITALNFLEGLGNLEKEFTVAMAAARPNAKDAGAAFLALTPRDEGDVQFKQIVLAIDRKTNLASEVFLVDALENETHLTFLAPSLNKGLPAETFVFKIPSGAEVIKPTLLQ